MRGPALLCCLAALAGCDRVFGIGDPYADAGTSDDAGADAQRVFHRTITIGAPGTTALVDFPVSILLDADDQIIAHAMTTSQIGFVDSSGNHLGCEVVSYDNTTGALDAWVLVPAVPASPGTVQIDLVYGDGVTPCGGTEAWPAAALAIWHSSLSFDRTLDSTSHGHDLLTFMNRGTPSQAPGLVGQALSFAGDGTLCEENATGDGSLDFGTDSFTFSLWLYERTTFSTFDSPLGKYESTGFLLLTGAGPWGVQFSSDGATTLTTAIQPESLGAWINIAIVVDRVAMLMRPYRDGVAGTSVSISSLDSLTSDGPVCMGRNVIDGFVDEAAIFAGALPPSWIQASYANVANRSQMIAIGPEH